MPVKWLRQVNSVSLLQHCPLAACRDCHPVPYLAMQSLVLSSNRFHKPFICQITAKLSWYSVQYSLWYLCCQLRILHEMVIASEAVISQRFSIWNIRLMEDLFPFTCLCALLIPSRHTLHDLPYCASTFSSVDTAKCGKGSCFCLHMLHNSY